MSFKQLDRIAREAGFADNDNRKPVAEDDGWRAPATSSRRGAVVRFPGDGPTIEYRTLANAAWQSSGRQSGQLTADNDNWPLAKVLRREGHEYLLSMAERYRDVHDRANMPVDLVGKDPADDIYNVGGVLHRTDLDESTGALVDKGVKRVTGKAHRAPDAGPRTFDRKRAKPVPKAWNGDWPLLDRIDAGHELASVRAVLGILREPFEAAVVDGDTLEAIGRREGVGQGAGAAGRALVMRGFMAVDQYWQRQQRAA